MKSYNRTYSFAVFIAMIIFYGCNPLSVPLKGNYPNSPLEITSTKSGDSLWLNITQLFAAKGLAVKSIDKKKGLIVTAKTPFIPVYTFEDKDGQLNESGAWVVLEKVFVRKRAWNPKTIYSQWHIQVTDTGKGTTTIKINPTVICIYYPNMFTSMEAQAQSTGRLEELIKTSLIDSLTK